MYLYMDVTTYKELFLKTGGRHRSGSRELACKGWDHQIEPAWRGHLQFGQFFIPISGPSKDMVCAVLSVGKCI